MFIYGELDLLYVIVGLTVFLCGIAVAQRVRGKVRVAAVVVAVPAAVFWPEALILATVLAGLALVAAVIYLGCVYAWPKGQAEETLTTQTINLEPETGKLTL